MPSSRTQRLALEGLAKVEMKGPRDWKAAWRTWNQRQRRGDPKLGRWRRARLCLSRPTAF